MEKGWKGFSIEKWERLRCGINRKFSKWKMEISNINIVPLAVWVYEED